jgi:metal-responsive CopG/Arc/MetJ family transcriptional regulator
METVQIVLGKELLRAADRAVRRRQVNRSAFVREALREHLKREAARDREQRDRAGYQRQPLDPVESAMWDKVAAWPEEWSGARFVFSGSHLPTRPVRCSFSRALLQSTFTTS